MSKREPIDLSTRVALRLPEAADALGLSERKLRQIRSKLPIFDADGTPLVSVALLEKLIAENSQIGDDDIDRIADEIGTDIG